jgi:hypothetical protein
MKNKLTKVLAIIGTILVWLTVLSPVLLWIGFSIRRGAFGLDHFDYLMPAELFPVALVGGLLLVGVALWVRRHRLLVGGSLGLAVILLVGMQGLAVVTGLAHGETQPGGWEWALVMGTLGAFVLTLVGLGVGGVLLWRQPGKKL